MCVCVCLGGLYLHLFAHICRAEKRKKRKEQPLLAYRARLPVVVGLDDGQLCGATVQGRHEAAMKAAAVHWHIYIEKDEVDKKRNWR